MEQLAIPELTTTQRSSRLQRLRNIFSAGVLIALATLPGALSVLPWRAAGVQPALVTVADTVFALGLHVACLLALLALVGRARRALWVLGPAAVLAPVEALYLYNYGQPTGAHIYGVVLDTHAEEVLSWAGPHWLHAGVVALAVLMVVAWSCMQCWRADWRWEHRSRWWALVMPVLLASVVLLQLAEARLADEADIFARGDAPEEPLSSPSTGLAGLLENSYPWGLAVRLAHLRQHQQVLADHQQRALHHDFHVRQAAGRRPPAREVHLLVIGETGRPDRWQLFGSPRETTPHLSSRLDLIPFRDAVSPVSATRMAVPLMLTRRPADAPLAQLGEPSFVTAFKQAGYKTHWLSTQGAAGFHETPISVLAREADVTHFVNASDYRGHGALDDALLPLLRETLARADSRQLIVLHTLGSHLHYAHRYPESFARFQPALKADDTPDIWNTGQQVQMRNAYDNSVLFTDHLLQQVITALEQTGVPSTLLYVADHGETLFDGSCGRAGHGFASEVNFRVPMFMWLSPQWAAQHAARTAALHSRRSQPVTTLSVFDTMLGQAGIEIGGHVARRDLGRQPVPGEAPIPRTVHPAGDFDQAIKNRTCSSQPPLAPP